VKLELPQDLSSMFHTFHISRVKPFIESQLEYPERKQLDRPPPELIEGKVEYEIEQLLDKREMKIGKTRSKKSIIQYLVKWRGYPMSECTWQNAEDLKQHAAGSIEDYENQHSVNGNQQLNSIKSSVSLLPSDNVWMKVKTSLIYDG
jgi:hypothetical protein